MDASSALSFAGSEPVHVRSQAHPAEPSPTERGRDNSQGFEVFRSGNGSSHGQKLAVFRSENGSSQGQNLALTGLRVPSSLETLTPTPAPTPTGGIRVIRRNHQDLGPSHPEAPGLFSELQRRRPPHGARGTTRAPCVKSLRLCVKSLRLCVKSLRLCVKSHRLYLHRCKVTV